MSAQPEALRIAHELCKWSYTTTDVEVAAEELRRLTNEVTDLKQALDISNAVAKERDRLHKVNAELLKESKDFYNATVANPLLRLTSTDKSARDWAQVSGEKLRAAIAKAEGAAS